MAQARWRPLVVELGKSPKTNFVKIGSNSSPPFFSFWIIPLSNQNSLQIGASILIGWCETHCSSLLPPLNAPPIRPSQKMYHTSTTPGLNRSDSLVQTYPATTLETVYWFWSYILRLRIHLSWGSSALIASTYALNFMILLIIGDSTVIKKIFHWCVIE